MKKVLSSLLAFAFIESQGLVLAKGPDFSGDGAISTVGTYAGVLVVRSETNPSPNVTSGSAAAIGLFSIGVPASGIANGDAVIFVDGAAYNGNIIGVANPNDDTLTGIVEGTSNFTVPTTTQTGVDANGNPVFTTTQTNIFAQGNLKTTISQPFVPSGTQLLVTTGITISGTAELDLFSELNQDGTPDVTNTVNFDVDGIQQSATVTTSTLSLNGNGGGSGTGTGTGS